MLQSICCVFQLSFGSNRYLIYLFIYENLHNLNMIEIFFPILEHFCPLFVQIAQMDLVLPRWGLILPRIPPQILFCTLQSHSPLGGMYVNQTPRSPPQNTSFHDLNLKVGKINYSLCNFDPNCAKCLKSGQIFSRS